MYVKLDGVKINRKQVYYGETADDIRLGSKGETCHPTAFFRMFFKSERRQIRKKMVAAGHRDVVLMGL